MPEDKRSPGERLGDEWAAKQLASLFAKRPPPQPKPETCPYCGSTDLAHHRIPLDLTDEIVTCQACGEQWGEI